MDQSLSRLKAVDFMENVTSSQQRDSQTDAATIISVNQLSKSYGKWFKKVSAINNISFSVKKGEIYGLIGADGAGKTSILQILAGVLSANDGQASICGNDVIHHPESVKSIIGYMPQGLGLNLYDTLTVSENIEFFRELRKVPDDKFLKNRDSLLSMTRLQPFLNRPAENLSGGMRQKLALICTLIHLPDILLLDEPTTGVDPISRRDFWTIIHELVSTRQVTVLLTTSYMDEAERCHQVGLMHEGSFIANGKPDELITSLPGHLYAVDGAPLPEILSALRSWSGAESVALFGSKVHVLLSNNDSSFLRDRLTNKGVVTAQLQLIDAGLEDVFVHQLYSRKKESESSIASDLIDTASPTNDKAEKPIEIHALNKSFGHFNAVTDVSFSVNRGEIFGLLGPNGAGKTTLIKMLCGLLPASKGEATVAGYCIDKNRDEIRSHIGYVAQRFSLYRDLSVKANLELYAGLYSLSKQQIQTRIPTLLAQLNLEQFANRKAQSLPIGLRQRLALACALLHNPSLLFLDEPTSGVDPIARRQFWDIVHLLAQQSGVSVLVSTHYMDEAEHCDRLGLMQQGKLIALDTPLKLKQQAKEKSGSLIQVKARNFSQAYTLLHHKFSNAMLYGRHIQWQSKKPELDIQLALLLLNNSGIEAKINQQELSMEETFASFINVTGHTND